MLTDKKVCEMAVHFNENKHEFQDLDFVAIEKVDLVNGENANNPLLTREAYWMVQLCTISPYGLRLAPSLSRMGFDRVYPVYYEISFELETENERDL
jgi:hypothetical protein